MCSFVDNAMIPTDQTEQEHETNSIRTSSTTSAESAMCKKCKTAEPNLTLRKKDSYCTECFLASCRHKFRATLGKHKIMNLDEMVLVSFQGNKGE